MSNVKVEKKKKFEMHRSKLVFAGNKDVIGSDSKDKNAHTKLVVSPTATVMI